jgi:hypothetical protein
MLIIGYDGIYPAWWDVLNSRSVPLVLVISSPWRNMLSSARSATWNTKSIKKINIYFFKDKKQCVAKFICFHFYFYYFLLISIFVCLFVFILFISVSFICHIKYVRVWSLYFLLWNRLMFPVQYYAE